MPSRFDPLRDLDRLAQSVGQGLGQLLNRPGDVRARRVGDATELEVDLPGVKAADIDLTVDAERVVVRAVRRTAGGDGGGGGGGGATIERTWEVEGPVDVEGVSAGYEDGVLTVRLPKPAGAPARRVPVGAAGNAASPTPPAPPTSANPPTPSAGEVPVGPTDAGAGTVPPTAPPPPGEQANPLPTS